MKNIMYCLISATTKYVMIVHNFQQVNLKVFLGALRRWPISAIQTVIPFLAIVSISAVEVIAAPEVKIAAIKNLSLKL